MGSWEDVVLCYVVAWESGSVSSVGLTWKSSDVGVDVIAKLDEHVVGFSLGLGQRFDVVPPCSVLDLSFALILASTDS